MRIPELTRINELAAIAKTRALNSEERNERQILRRRYLDAVKGQMNNILSTCTVVDSEGNDVTPAKLRVAQAAGMTVSA